MNQINRRTNPDVFRNGKGVCVLVGEHDAIDSWVRAVAKKADAQVDWHYSGGRASVLHLGDDESRQRVITAINELEGKLQGYILSVGGPALYRDGDKVPEGTIGVDPDFGPIIGRQ